MQREVEEGLAEIITNNLFAHEKQRMVKWMDKIIEMNCEALGWATKPNAFQHRGNVYRHSVLPEPFGLRKLGIPVICRDLAPEMEKYLDEVAILANDKDKIRQFLLVLLRPLNGTQMIRDALPDCLVRHAYFQHIQREFPQEMVWQLTHNQIMEYHKLLPLMQMYNGAGLLI